MGKVVESVEIATTRETRIALSFVPYHERHVVQTIYVEHMGPCFSRELVRCEALTSNLGVMVVERVNPESPLVKRVMHVLINSPLWHEDSLYEVGTVQYPETFYSINVRRENHRDIFKRSFNEYMKAQSHLTDFILQCNQYLLRHAHPDHNNLLRTET